MSDQQTRFISTIVALGLAIIWNQPSGGQTSSGGKQPVTAKITLGPLQGDARPSLHGQSKTVGGTIDVSQPSPDKLVVRMSGSAAAIGCCLKNADAAMEFMENLQFMVEFSQPGFVGTLMLDSRADGLLTSQGKEATAGMLGATATVLAGSQDELVTVSLPERIIGGCDSVAVSVSEGPVCVPVASGCYALQQQFQIGAFHKSGVVVCGKATAEFATPALPPAWLGASYPFADVDRSHLGYTVTLRVLPKAVELASHAQHSTETVALVPPRQSTTNAAR